MPGHEDCKRMAGVVVELFRMKDDNSLNVLTHTLYPCMAVRSDGLMYRYFLYKLSRIQYSVNRSYVSRCWVMSRVMNTFLSYDLLINRPLTHGDISSSTIVDVNLTGPPKYSNC